MEAKEREFEAFKEHSNNLLERERHLNKRRSMEEPVKDDDSDSLDGPNDQELVSLLRPDSPTELTNGKGSIQSQISKKKT